MNRHPAPPHVHTHTHRLTGPGGSWASDHIFAPRTISCGYSRCVAFVDSIQRLTNHQPLNARFCNLYWNSVHWDKRGNESDRVEETLWIRNVPNQITQTSTRYLCKMLGIKIHSLNLSKQPANAWMRRPKKNRLNCCVCFSVCGFSFQSIHCVCLCVLPVAFIVLVCGYCRQKLCESLHCRRQTHSTSTIHSYGAICNQWLWNTNDMNRYNPAFSTTTHTHDSNNNNHNRIASKKGK